MRREDNEPIKALIKLQKHTAKIKVDLVDDTNDKDVPHSSYKQLCEMLTNTSLHKTLSHSVNGTKSTNLCKISKKYIEEN
jgi:hypothetical protein